MPLSSNGVLCFYSPYLLPFIFLAIHAINYCCIHFILFKEVEVFSAEKRWRFNLHS